MIWYYSGIYFCDVTIRLFADAEDTGKTLELSEDNHWTGTFEDLDESTGEGSGEDPEGGSRISYTVEEEKTGVITGEDGEGTYADAVSGDADQGYTVTNTHTPSKTEVKVNKVWNDGNDQDRIRPESVTIKLFADGEDTGKKLVLSEENTWSGSFTGLMKQKDGQEIRYTVEEEMNDVNDFMAKFGSDFEIKWGLAMDPELGKKVKVTILATGFGIQDVDGMNGHLMKRTQEDADRLAQEEENTEPRQATISFVVDDD